MTAVVQQQPLFQAGLDLRLGVPSLLARPIIVGMKYANVAIRSRTTMPTAVRHQGRPGPSAVVRGCDRIGKCKQSEGHRCHVDPKQQAGVGPVCGTLAHCGMTTLAS